MPLSAVAALSYLVPRAVEVTVDGTTWAALALVLTVIGGALSWVAWRRRGAAAGIRGLAWTLVPVAAWLTGTLRLAADIVDDVASWAGRLVFSPFVWAGIVVAGVAVVLWVISGTMRSRGIGVRGKAAKRKARRVQRGGDTAEVMPGRRRSSGTTPTSGHSEDLDDMDDIEAILKKHGI